MAHSPRKGSPARWAAVILPPLCLGGLMAWTAGMFSPAAISPSHFMQRFHNAGAPDTGFRRAHAKGMCATGWFDPSPEGRVLSRSGVFKGEHLPVMGRFSLAPPMPYLPDNPAVARSLALQIRSATGDDWRMALVDVPLQPMRDIADAYAFFGAARLDPTTHKTDPAASQAYAAQRPWLKTAFEQVKAHKQSSDLTNDTYNSLDSFILTNDAGKQVAVRWSVVAKEDFSPAEGSGTNDGNYLFKRLVQTLDQKPLSWDIVATVAREGDPVNDPSQPWNEADQKVTVGTVTFTKAYSEDESPCGPMVFDPTILPDGISVSGDPLLALRSSIYMRSYATRSAEHKTPSMVTPGDVANPPLTSDEKGQ
ncbi:catalase [Bombella sp. TMW 2.2543]|uniref:Catalase-related peroxidase n=1 Tax=Bombella pluederhausensis TaxID=2967336 RepID=A0ABT3WHD6_9PROT|nr:catalase [Bombella pluederhausensis]MCX5618490.1 catalase [Bombella pluederhausensis]